MYKPAPHVINIGKDCGEYLRILDGPPQSVTMRSGRVTIAPGKSVGTHSTGDYEELVIVLEGQGEARPAGHPPMIFEAGDAVYVPPETERRELFGLTLEQKRNDAEITSEMFTKSVKGENVPANIAETLAVATVALKYTQSNSVCLAYDGQVIGMGAGQQSRIHCTRLACGKAEKWFLQQHPKVLGLNFKDGLGRPEKTNVVDQYLLSDELSDPEMEQMLSGLKDTPEPITRGERMEWIKGFDNICLSSDAFIPFRDNIDRASRTNVQFIAQPGNSLRDESVTEAATGYGMVMIHTGVRCFLH